MALYFMDMRAIFRPPGQKARKPGEVLPWLEEDRLAGPNKFIPMPAPPKPTLEKERTISAAVYREGDERGQIEMTLGADGTIAGRWNCRFSQGAVEKTFTAAFKGNIDISKTFQDTDGENPSLLYLYTKGDYSESTSSKEMPETSEGGLIYVTGWLRPDGNSYGTMTITNDKKWRAEYRWKSP
jgi:hypothetical protein